MNFYSSKAFLANIEAIRCTNAAHNARVNTRQAARATMRRQYAHFVDGTRKERRQMSRAIASREWRRLAAAVPKDDPAAAPGE